MAANLNNELLKDLIEKALKRAALSAREVALKTNTPIIIANDDEILEISVTEQDVMEYRKKIKDAISCRYVAPESIKNGNTLNG